MKVQLRSAEATTSSNNGKFHKLSLFNAKKPQPKRDVIVEDLSKKLLPIIGSSKFAAILYNVFSPEECVELIKGAEAAGFEDALIQGPTGEILRTDVRKCGRRIIDDAEVAEEWYQRTIHAIEGSGLEDKLLNAPWTNLNWEKCDTPIQAVGLNERLRFLKYEKGDRFGPHLDNRYVRGPEHGERAGETSQVTFLLFLNDKMKGGMLRFEGGNRTFDVTPKIGSVAIFDHDIYHEGCEVTSGRKYAVRSDIMYSKK